jgi:nucleotide-binding universal stress UspA family protein
MARPIVVGVDPTADSLAALATAAGLAEQSHAPIIAVHVRHEPALAAEGVVGAEAAAMSTTLDEIEESTRTDATNVMAGRRVEWRLAIAAGDPAAELIKQAVSNNADAIVVGGRNHGVVGGLVIGSVAQKLVRKSPVSVLVVRDGQAHRVNDASKLEGVG